MPPTVNSSFLSEAVNRLVSFNLIPERFHIPDIVYPLFFIHSGEHRFISDSRHKLRFHLLTTKFKCNFSHGFLFILILPQVWLPSNWNLSFSTKIPCICLWFWFDLGFSGIFYYAYFFFFSVLLFVSPCLVLSKFLNPEEPRHPFCHFSWWRNDWLCSGQNKQFDHQCWFAQVCLFS